MSNRKEGIAALQRNYPTVSATWLYNKLYSLALRCEMNAIDLCNTEGHVDKRDELREELRQISKDFGIVLRGDVTGDPRGYCLKLHLPDQSSNTWGGKEAGFGIGKN